MVSEKDTNLFGEEAPSQLQAPKPQKIIEEFPDIEDQLGGKYRLEEVGDAFIERVKAHRAEEKLAKIPEPSRRKWARVCEKLVRDHGIRYYVMLQGSYISRKTKGPAGNTVHLYVDELFADEIRLHPALDEVIAAIHDVTGEWVFLKVYNTTAPEFDPFRDEDGRR